MADLAEGRKLLPRGGRRAAAGGIAASTAVRMVVRVAVNTAPDRHRELGPLRPIVRGPSAACAVVAAVLVETTAEMVPDRT